ncbi:MAG: RDD family protein [Bacteroidia bacterium]
MKSIEISTTQNVTIKYELASPFVRLLAFLVDIVIISLAQLILALALSSFITESYWYSYLWMPFLFYSLVFESLNKGATPGKKVFGIRVMRVDGREIQFTDYLMRWIFRLVDIVISFGSMAMFFSLSSEKSQRIGDYMANTVVVILKKHRRFSIDGLVKFESLSDYEVMFPQVVNLTEAEMLLLKEVLNKHKSYNNQAHDLALETTSKIIAKRLNIDKPKNDPAFIKKLIKDYVVLTR